MVLAYGIPPDFHGGVHSFFKPHYTIWPVPSLSGHAVASRWRSLRRVRRHMATKPQGKFQTGAALASHHFFFSFISLIADGPHHYHPACGHKGSSHLSPVHALQFFYRDASSALLQLVNQWLNFTYSRSHAFRYEKKNTNFTLVRIELTTSALAGMQVTY